MTETRIRAAAGTSWANLRVPGSDGTQLAVDVHLPPENSWPVPVVVTRTPYGRSQHHAEGRGWRRHGYGYVVGDVRGRYDSDGEWTPYRHERADGAAMADWICAQPWCDGQLVAYGGSYSGYTAWATAVERPELVTAVVSLGPSMSLARTKFDPAGVLRLGEHAAWWLERADARTSRDGLARLVFADQPDLLDHLPVIEIAEILGARLPHWADLLTMGDQSELISDAELAHLSAASLHVGGWYDLLLPESLHHWRVTGAAHAVRPPRRMVIGPWGHELAFGDTTRVGEREHGPRSQLGFDRLCLTWLAQILAGDRPEDTAEIFVLGENTWHTGPGWPATADASTTDEVTFFTHPGCGLARTPSRISGHAQFYYDPLDPFPSRRPGADRADTQARPDAARWFSEPLPQPCTIWGRARVELAADTDAASADWTVRLLERRADGRLIEIARGTAVDDAAQRTIMLSPVAITLPPGAVLVLEVTTSDFPDLARNLGTGADRYTSAEARVSRQSVTWGAHGTTVHLPLRQRQPAQPPVPVSAERAR